MPRAIAIDDDHPRRSGKRTVAEPAAARGRIVALLLSSPKDVLAGAVAAAAVFAIIANAIFLQAGRHPAPMFGPPSNVALNAPIVLPRPRPADATPKQIDSRMFEARPVDGRSEPKPAATEQTPVVKAAPAPAAASNAARPPASIPAPTAVAARSADPLGDLITNSRRVAAVQKALTDYGYGQLKPTGNVGNETQAAIAKFERDRKLQVSGQMSERLVRELVAMTGRPIE